MDTLSDTMPLITGRKNGHPARSLFTRLEMGRLLIRVASLLACLLIWHFLSTNHINLRVVTFENVPSPGQVLSELVFFIQSTNFSAHLLASLSRVFSGFLIASFAGVLLGLLIGRFPLVADILLPPLEVLRPIPGVAWIPLSILMFASSEVSMIFITFIGALFPILLNTIHGVREVDPRLIASARSLGSGRVALFTEVILPAASPSIFTGLSIGMGTAWFCLVTAEMIAGQFGIGYYTWASYTIQNYSAIVVGMLLIGVLGMGSSLLIKKIGALLTPWN